MLQIFTEKPLILILGGTLVLVILFVIWLQTYHRALVIGMAAVLAATILAVVVERLVVTDRESVVNTLYEIAATVKTKDLDRLLAYIHSSRRDIRDQAATEYRQYELTDVKITQVSEVQVDPHSQPKKATVRFIVLVIGGLASGVLENQHAVIHMIVTFQKEGNDWKVVAYAWRPLQEAFQQHPAEGQGGY